MVQEKLNGFYMDMRPNSIFEKALPYFLYLPICVLYILVIFFVGLRNVYYMLKCMFKHDMPTEQECHDIDDNSTNLISMAELETYNKNRGAAKGEEFMLEYGSLYYIYHVLNQRTEFVPDDTFSQKTAVWVHIYKVMNDDASYVPKNTESEYNQNDDEEENFTKMEVSTKSEFKKAQSYRSSLQIMCYLSIATSALALGQIFFSLFKGERIFVICTFENAVLRFCFTYIIFFIGIRDLQQITINLFVRTSGVMMKPSQSRWVMVEFLVRISITILAMMTILIMIFTTSKDAYESVIDQTMNFTALVILLEVDNILAELLQSRIDQYEIDFSYNKDTIEKEFNVVADF